MLSIILFVLSRFTCELPLTPDFILISIRIKIIGILRKVKSFSRFKIALGAAVFKFFFKMLKCAKLCKPLRTLNMCEDRTRYHEFSLFYSTLFLLIARLCLVGNIQQDMTLRMAGSFIVEAFLLFGL